MNTKCLLLLWLMVGPLFLSAQREREPIPLNLNELRGMIGYPPLAKEREIQGKVILRVFINEKGDYVKHAVIEDPNPILTSAVESKIHHLKFSPGIIDGKPIKVWVTIPFDFKLLTNPPAKSVLPNNKPAFHSLGMR